MGALAFVFAGQGAQYPGMGKALYETSAAARAVFDRVEALRPGTLAQCFSGTAEELSQTCNTQPCLFAVDYACAEAAMEAGLHPDCCAGFSLGEVVAVGFAGILSFDRAFEFVLHRAERMQACAEKVHGAMGAVLRLSAQEVEEICTEFPDQAFPVNYNCPGQTVVACNAEVYDALAERVTARKGRMIKLNVSGAFHTPWMGEASLALNEFLRGETLAAPRMPVYANVNAQPYGSDAAMLLSRQASNPVRWQESIENMAKSGVDTFVELGAGKTLSGLIRKILPNAKIYNLEKPEDLEKLKEVHA